MTAALTLHNDTAPAPAEPLDPARWCPIEEAAERLGISIGQLRRRCSQTLAAQGRAKIGASDDGKERWHVLRDTDRRLRDHVPGAQAPALDQYPKRHVDLAWHRASCVQQFRKARCTWKGRQRDWMPALLQQLQREHPMVKNLSGRSLQRWDKLYAGPHDIEKLIFQRGGNQKGEPDPAAIQFFRECYLDSRKPTIRVCWERTRDHARAQELKWCSYTQAVRKLKKWIPPELATMIREPEQYKQMAPYIERHAESHAAGECWIGDHATLDFWLLYDGKPARASLTAWMDWRTRKIVGWCLSVAPDSSTILAALRSALIDPANMGGPAKVWIDNGKDYDAWTFHGQTKKQRHQKIKAAVDESATEGVFNLLDIEVHWSIPHNPNGKSRLEKWFDLLHDRFDRTWISYCGNTPDNRPAHVNELLAKRRHELPTFAEVLERLAAFIAGYNASVEHYKQDLVDQRTGERLSPDQAMARLATVRRRMADPNVLNQLLQHWHQPVMVGRNGVTINVKGAPITYGYADPALRPYRGRLKKDRTPLRVAYDPNDLRTIEVYRLDYTHVATLKANHGMGDNRDAVGVQHVKELIRHQRKYAKAKNDYRHGHRHEYLSKQELLGDIAAQDREQAPADLPIKVVHTALDGQAEVADQRRKLMAAGAESVDIWDDEAFSLADLDPGPPVFDDDDHDDDFVAKFWGDFEPKTFEQQFEAIKKTLDHESPENGMDAPALKEANHA